MTPGKAVVAAVLELTDQHDGYVKPEHVVEAARPVDSILHPHIFKLGMEEASEQWYLEEARKLIRVCVTFLPVDDAEVKIRVFTSLTPDRAAGRGYRTTVSVLGEEAYRRQLLADALSDLETFERRYRSLVELADVFGAIRKVRTRMGKKVRKSSSPRATMSRR